VDFRGKGSELPLQSNRSFAMFGTSSFLGSSAGVPNVTTASDSLLGSAAPDTVRYVKLGEGGQWAADAFKRDIIPLGYSTVAHTSCLRGDWQEVRRQLAQMGRSPNGVSNGLRELKEFYELPDDTLWVTLACGHIWWTFAQGPVVGVDEAHAGQPGRYRKTLAGWSKSSLTGEPLTVRSLSSALTRTANYRMTICSVKKADYLLRRIRGEVDPLHVEATVLMKNQQDLVLKMIRQLDWRDFETLIDLIFARGGWQRESALGGDQADVDMILKQPTINETAWVQIKARSSQAELDDYLTRFRTDGSYDCFFFICHSAAGELRLPAEPGLHLWTADRVTKAALDAGLFGWLDDRTR
jgi:hypothetical protein